jgi:hypothetical protein
MGARLIGIVGEPGLEPAGRAALLRHGGKSRLWIVHGAARLGQPELAEQEVSLARFGCDPVRIAAAGIEQGVGGFGGAGLCEFDQAVLDLERAHLVEFCIGNPHAQSEAWCARRQLGPGWRMAGWNDGGGLAARERAV